MTNWMIDTCVLAAVGDPVAVHWAIAMLTA